jgi:WD40 repeat protein
MFITALKNHLYQVSKAIFLKEAGWLATSSWDCTVKIWDLRNILNWESGIKTIKSEYPVLTIEQVSDDVIAFGGDDCYMNFYNWRTL